MIYTGVIFARNFSSKTSDKILRMKLSLIIPAYNEEVRIGDTLAAVFEYLSKQEYTWEVIVVDDGSQDGTAEIAKQAKADIQVIAYQPNRGKGFAVKTGMQAAKGEIRVFFDADASTPIEEIEKLWPQFDDGADVVIGSRVLPDSDVEVHQAKCRELMGKTYNLMLRCMALTSFRDTQCGFKAFTAESSNIIFPKQTIDRFGFDCELLHIAKIHALRIEQVPVRWINSPASRLHPIVDSIKMFQDLVSVRLKAFRGIYS